MRKAFAVLLVFSLLQPASALAYGKRPFGRTSSISRTSTTGTFINRQVWLPGTWTVNESPEEVTFKRTVNKRESVVRIKRTARDACGYGVVRIRALKAWGGRFLEQSQARIQPISFGTSKYKGYTWMEPSTWNGTHFWCLAQDLTGAMELSAPEGDTDTITFIKNDLLLQLAVRSGRSVMPWPQASDQSPDAPTR